MAKYERTFQGDLDTFLADVDAAVMDASATATRVDSSDVTVAATRVSVRVYERFSMFGSSRVSLTLTVAGSEGWVWASAIASGGSQGVVFKVNTFSEENFLATAVAAIDAAVGVPQ